MRGLVAGGFYVFGSLALLNVLLNACSQNENSGTGAATSLVIAVVLIGIGHLISPMGGGAGRQQVDPAEYARIARDRAVEQARAAREQQMRDAQAQIEALKRDVIAQAQRRNRELGGDR